MILGRVTATLVSSVKHEAYKNRTILVVKPVTPNGTLTSGAIVAVDTVGAGEGDTVLVAAGGRTGMEILGNDHGIPVRSVIIGIVDRIVRGEPGTL